MKMRILLSIVILLTSATPHAFAAPINECQLPSAKWGVISLGFPVVPERLALKTNPNILVIPYYFKGQEKILVSAKDKEVFAETAQNISNLSAGLSKVNFSFNTPIEVDISSQELDDIKKNANVTYAKDFENSTWGFVARTIKNADSSINYSGIDAVILYGSGKSSVGGIAEAMTFASDTKGFMFNPSKPDGTSWYAPISTTEKQISNVVLLFGHQNSYTATHEVLHLYGLTDLYGNSEGPGRLSVMAGLNMDLLTYEKWLLGWHNNNKVFCESSPPVDSIIKFDLNYKDSNHLALIRTSENTTLVIETTSGKYLSYYKLQIDRRPPLTFYTRDPRGVAGIDLSENTSIGKIVKGETLSMLVSNKTGSSITVYLFPNVLSDSPQVSSLIASTNAELELQAKQETETKVVPEIIGVETKTAVVVSARKITITCIKGKVVKKVSAIKPLCPAGYKKK